MIRRNHAKVGTAPGVSIYEPKGGGVRITTATLRNCLLEGNQTDQGIQQCGFNGTMESCTVVGGMGGNSAYGGPVDSASLVCVNSIIVSNSLGVSLASRNSIRTTGHVYVTNSFLEPFPGRDQVLANYTLVDSITGDEINPQFADYAGKDFRLASGSPCIDRGSNQDWMISAVDLDGTRRIDRVSGVVDLGAYEHQNPGSLLFIR